MGQCYIVRRGGAGRSVPILKEAYPADLEVWGDGGSATFKVEIEKEGRPNGYTYEWYRDGEKLQGAQAPQVTLTSLSTPGTHSIYCVVTNATGSVISRTATLTVKDPEAAYTFTGSDGSDEKIIDSTGAWKIKLKASGKLAFTSLGKDWDGALDVFLVGGGSANYYAVGGSGGNTKTAHIYVRKDLELSAQIGAGGTNRGSGGNTSLAGISATGGNVSGGTGSGGGGSGSTLGGMGGTDGGSGQTPSGAADGANGRSGQGTTTREFGESTGTLYSAGGGGESATTNHKAGASDSSGAAAGTSAADNTGSGAGGSSTGLLLNGGSGIVVVRKAVSPSVTISQQPQDLTVDGNESAVFTITASGTGLTYQWQRLSNANATWTNTTVTGYNTNQLTVNKYSYSDGVQYRCIVTDSTGYQIISAPALLTVQS